MREKLHHQLPLTPPPIDHEHARELAAISDILDANREVLEPVMEDLTRGLRVKSTGRSGMTAEQVLRSVVVKQMNGFSYEELAFHLADSTSYRRFCGFGMFDRTPKASTLQENVKRLSAETFSAISRVLLGHAKREGIEKGRTVRFDCTVTPTNIHHPTDSSLLWDVVRVLARTMGAVRDAVGLPYHDRSRRAKRRALEILNAKNARQRKPLYQDLLKATDETLTQARAMAKRLQSLPLSKRAGLLQVEAWRYQLEHYAALGKRVREQTYRRIFLDEKVLANEKVASIFEPHTDIIVKKRRETEFGHKVALATGRSNLILDCVVLEGNPADSTLAVDLVVRQLELYRQLPRQVAFDGGFAAKENLRKIKGLGVLDVAFNKKRGLEVSEMAKSSWVYKKLRNFRAGIEGGISFLKRCFGLARCTWRGFASYKSYVWASVVSANLLMLARHKLRAAT